MSDGPERMIGRGPWDLVNIAQRLIKEGMDENQDWDYTRTDIAEQRIAELEAEQSRLWDQEKYLLNAENILRRIGYTRCTAAACNCYGYHKETDNE
jgi:hypothetical protein